MDRPAVGEKFVIVKSESGAAPTAPASTEEQMACGTEAQKAGGGAPAAPPAPMSEPQQKAPGPPVAAPAAPEPGAPPEEAGPPSSQSGAALVLPMGAKTPLLGALQAVASRIAEIITSLDGAIETDGAEMPSAPIVAIADAAGAMANCIEPYVMKQAGSGMAAEPSAPSAASESTEGASGIAKADGGPWTREYIDTLPDCSFLDVEPSTEHDNDWRTIPLSNRKFPVRDHAYRLCLPMVVAAVEQIGSSAEPFLSAQKKRRLLLRLASMRLDEVSIAAVRDEPMGPDTGAELLSIAELLGSVGGMASPAAPAAGDAAAVTQAAMPMEQQMSAFAKAYADRIREVASFGKVSVAKADAGSLGQIAGELRSVLAKVDSMCGGAVAAKSAPVTPSAEITKALADKDAELEKAKSALAAANVSLTKAQTDLAATKVQLAKAERRVPPSNVVGEERTDVAKSSPAYPPLSRDLNADFEREDRERQRVR